MAQAEEEKIIITVEDQSSAAFDKIAQRGENLDNVLAKLSAQMQNLNLAPGNKLAEDLYKINQQMKGLELQGGGNIADTLAKINAQMNGLDLKGGNTLADTLYKINSQMNLTPGDGLANSLSKIAAQMHVLNLSSGDSLAASLAKISTQMHALNILPSNLGGLEKALSVINAQVQALNIQPNTYLADALAKITAQMHALNLAPGNGLTAIHAQMKALNIQPGSSPFSNIADHLNQVNTASTSAGGGLQRLMTMLNSSTPSVAQLNSAFVSLQQGIGKANGVLETLVTAGAWSKLWDLGRDTFTQLLHYSSVYVDKITEIQRTKSMLATIPDSNAGQEFDYLIATANKYGVSLKAVQQNYLQLQLAAVGTTLSHEGVRKVFEQTSLASRVLHLSTHDTHLAFVALVQMLSKGTVSMEEFRKQLSQRIPGMIPGVAAELGVQTAELEKFIASGKAASDKMLPYIGNAFQRIYEKGGQNATNALDAELNRISNSVTAFFRMIEAAGGAEGPTAVLKALNAQLNQPEIAKGFADMVNNVSSMLTKFISSLTSEDFRKAGNQATEVLKAIAEMSILAARGMIYLSQNLTSVGTVLGAYFGAKAGLAVSGTPLGALIGAGIGAIVGNRMGNSMSGERPVDVGQQLYTTQTAAYNASIDRYGVTASKNTPEGVKAGDLLTTAIRERDALRKEFELRLGSELSTSKAEVDKWEKKVDRYTSDLSNLNPTSPLAVSARRDLEVVQASLLTAQGKYNSVLSVQATMTKGTTDQFAMPALPDLPGKNSNAGKLDDMIGNGKAGKKGSHGSGSGVDWVERQKDYMNSLVDWYNGIMTPEDDKFENKLTALTKLGADPGTMMGSNGLTATFMVEAVRAKKASDFKEKHEQLMKNRRAHADYEMAQREGEMNKQVAVTEEGFNDVGKPVFDQQMLKKRTELNAMTLSAVRLASDKNTTLDEAFKIDVEDVRKRSTEAADSIINNLRRTNTESRKASTGVKNYNNEVLDESRNYAKITHGFISGTFKTIEDQLTNLVTTGKFSFAALGDFITNYITRLIITQAMTKIATSGGSDFLGGIMGMFLGSAAGGGGSTSSTDYSLGSSNSSMNADGTGFQMRATGGLMYPGQEYMVGEAGPERMRVSNLTRIDPAQSDTSQARPITVHNTFVLNAPVDKQTQQQLAATAGVSIQRAMARNN